MSKAKQLWHVSETKSELRDVVLETSTNTDLVLVKSLYSNISIGTEKMVANGEIPEDIWAKMQVPYQLGNFDLPISYGYSLIVELEQKNYHLMHPHHSQCLVHKNSLTRIPEELSPKIATQISNMETVINAIWESEPQEQDVILVCGFGSIGSLLATTLSKEYGLQVFVHEINPKKKEMAEKLGFQTSNSPREYSICYNTTANASALQYCIDHSREEGQIFELSWYGNRKVSLDLGGVFHTNRIQIKGVQVSKIPFPKAPKENFQTRKKWAMELLIKHQKYYSLLVTNMVSIDNSPQFFKQLRNNKNKDEILNLIHY